MYRPKVLIIHALRPTSRKTTVDHLLAFREHLPNADVQYLHFAQPIPKDALNLVEPDLLIVNYDYLNYRFTPLWPYIRNRHRQLARRARRVVAIAQDDFWAHRLLDNWCVAWGVDRVLTPIDTDREVLYPRAAKRAEFRTVLTGYAPAEIEATPRLRDRPIDLGQRVRATPAHLGHFAQMKAEQAIVLAEAARRAGFVVDVSTRIEDSLVGQAWPRFLQSCKFTMGMKGGASIADPFGLLYNRVEAYQNRRSQNEASTESFKFLRRRDGKYQFSAVSPRLFEAASAGTCQILRRDDYLGVLEPWTHYVPLEHDFSNMSEVLNVMRDLDRCEEIAGSAKNRLIATREFGYQHLVSSATEGLLPTTAMSADQAEWAKLTNHLAESAKLVADGQIELHDAALHLIHESLSNSGSKASAAVRVITDRLATASHREWFRQMYALSMEDSLTWRAPWIWRSLP